MRRISTLTLGLLVVAAAQSVAPAAFAEDKKNPLDGQPPVRHKVELRKLRFEIAPQLVVSMNQDFRHFIGGGLVLNFHINDWFGLALQIAGGGGVDTGLTSSINSKLLSESDPTYATAKPAFQPSLEQFQAHLGTINLVGSIAAQITPMAGKLSIFGALYLHYDLYAMAGFGIMNITNTWGSYTGTKSAPAACTNPQTANNDPNSCDPMNDGIKPSFMWGVGMHLFFNQWLALNLELRDFVASTNMGGLDVNGDRALNSDDATLTNNLFVGIGLTFMLPIHAKISP